MLDAKLSCNHKGTVCQISYCRCRLAYFHPLLLSLLLLLLLPTHDILSLGATLSALLPTTLPGKGTFLARTTVGFLDARDA